MKITHHSEQIQCQATTTTNDMGTSQSLKNGCGDLDVREMSPVLYTLNMFGINLQRKFKYPSRKSGASNVVWCAHSTAVLLFLGKCLSFDGVLSEKKSH